MLDIKNIHAFLPIDFCNTPLPPPTTIYILANTELLVEMASGFNFLFTD